jgi:hypothetical protein
MFARSTVNFRPPQSNTPLTLKPDLNMSIRFPISVVTIATSLTLLHGAIAAAEAYKSGPDQVVVNGLTAKQKYEVQAVSLKGKQGKKSAQANTCGELLINGTAKIKTLTIGTETIDVATLKTKAHTRCNPNKNTATTPTKPKAGATTTTSSPAPTTTTPATTTTTPAATTPTTK